MEKERAVKTFMQITTDLARRFGHSSFRFAGGYLIQQQIERTIDKLHDTFGGISEERLADYCIYVLYVQRDNNKILIDVLTSPKMVDKFAKRRYGARYFEDKWLELVNQTRSNIIMLAIDKSVHPHAKYIYMMAEERSKRRCLNQEAGYHLCQASTLGWSPLSEACQECNWVDDCKKETKHKFPELYRLREEYVRKT